MNKYDSIYNTLFLLLLLQLILLLVHLLTLITLLVDGDSFCFEQLENNLNKWLKGLV